MYNDHAWLNHDYTGIHPWPTGLTAKRNYQAMVKNNPCLDRDITN